MCLCVQCAKLPHRFVNLAFQLSEICIFQNQARYIFAGRYPDGGVVIPDDPDHRLAYFNSPGFMAPLSFYSLHSESFDLFIAEFYYLFPDASRISRQRRKVIYEGRWIAVTHRAKYSFGGVRPSHCRKLRMDLYGQEKVDLKDVFAGKGKAAAGFLDKAKNDHKLRRSSHQL